VTNKPNGKPLTASESKAPPPISPIKASSYISPPLPPVPEPNWANWGLMRDVELWEAVALSANFEPSKLPVYLGAYDKFGDDPFKICPPQFLERLQIANSNCGISFEYKPVHALKARCLVDLQHFAAWAKELELPAMPAKFLQVLQRHATTKKKAEETEQVRAKELDAMRMPTSDGGQTMSARLAKKPIAYHLPMFGRLQPKTTWSGGRMVDTDILTLEVAAKFASKHAGAEVTVNDFILAASRGEILLRAIVPRAVEMLPCTDDDEAIHIPKGHIQTLPLEACRTFANVGKIAWRTLDGHKEIDDFGGQICHFERWRLPTKEEDLTAEIGYCRVTGLDVHALADAFVGQLQTERVVTDLKPIETPEQRRARWLEWYGKGERGAVQAVYERELKVNPKADRSFIGKQIKLAKQEKASALRGGAWGSQLVKDGKRKS
jgi:hypothetical protein